MPRGRSKSRIQAKRGPKRKTKITTIGGERFEHIGSYMTQGGAERRAKKLPGSLVHHDPRFDQYYIIRPLPPGRRKQ